MVWSFLAVFFSGWLYVQASYCGSMWQRWLFKPLTLLLLMGLAWQAPAQHLSSYLVMAALLATLAGDALTLLPRQQLLYANGAFFLSHLFYAIWFAGQKMFMLTWPLPVVLLIVGVVLMSLIWRQLEELRWPVCLSVIMTLVMVWLAGDMYFFQHSVRNFSLFSGAILLLAATCIRLIRRYVKPFRGDQVLTAVCYFIGHFLLVRTLFL